MSNYGNTTTTDPVINAQTQEPSILAICISFSIISFVAVALRLYTRIRIVRRPGPDDVTIVFAEVIAVPSRLNDRAHGRAVDLF